MKWEKCSSDTSIEEVVERNTNLSAKELLNPEEEPYLYGLDLCRDVVLEHLNEKITIIGDYDCDGICGSSILYLALKEMGADVKVRIPRRFSEGYGLSIKIIDEIDEGMIITVDNGIAAPKQVKAAKGKGLTVVVTDHHLPTYGEDGKAIIPAADAVLAPKAESESAYKDYCGAALAFRLAKELIPEKKELLTKLIAFAGIGTVADVVPLKGANRYLVKESLKAVNKRKVTAGLSALLSEMQVLPATEDDYGFKLGPAMNAAGRLHDDGPMQVFKLLTYDEEPEWYGEEDEKASQMAKDLVALNDKRKDIVRESLERAQNILTDTDAPIVLYDPKFHEGIVGIIAGELCEKYSVPAIVLTNSSKEGVLKGSARSTEEIHLKNLLDEVQDYLLGYGGHAGAAGLSLKAENLEPLTKALKEKLKGKCKAADTLYYDLELNSADDVTGAIEELKIYAPYGEGNRKPVFLYENFILSPQNGKFVKEMGKRNEHIKFMGKDFNACGFFMKGRYEEEGSPKSIDILCCLSENCFAGKRNPEAEVLDFRPAESNDDYEDDEEVWYF